MKLEDLEAKLGISSNLTDEERLALVKDLQANLPSLKNNLVKIENHTQANLVKQAIKKIQENLENRFNELSGFIENKADSLVNGKDGKDGKNGKDGLNGKDGKDGLSITGPKGADGKDGEQGVGIADARVDFDGSLIITLTNGNEINAGEVFPLDATEKLKVYFNNPSVSGGGGSGTMSSQDANAVAITGGTIDGTPIGTTTRSSGDFTTLSANTVTSTTPVLSFNASNTIASFGSTTAGSYNQLVIQNKSNSAGASTNYVLSNNLGTDSTYYGEFGMNASTYSSGTPADFFSLNNGVYFSSHDGDITLGSGNGYKTFLAWGTAGQSAHVINATGAIGLNTNITGTTNFGTSGQLLTSGGSAATPTWSRLLPRVLSAASASSVTPDISAYDQYAFTALAAGLTINAPIGSPVDGDKLTFRILDNGTARSLTWNGTYTVIGTTLPTTTTINKTIYVGCIYNANNTRWDVVAVTTQV